MTKNKNVPIVPIMLLLLAVGVLWYSGAIFPASVTWGGSVITLSNVIIQSSSQFFAESNWMGTVVFNGGGQKIVGETIPGGVKTVLSPGYTSDKSLAIELNMDSEFMRYPTTKRLYNGMIQYLYTWQLTSPATPINYVCAIGRTHPANECIYGTQFQAELCGTNTAANQYTQACLDAGGIPVKCLASDAGSRKCVFATSTTKADIYELSSPTKEFSATFKMTTNGQTETVTTSSQHPSGVASNLAVVFQYFGAATAQPPSESSVMVVGDRVLQRLKLVPFVSANTIDQFPQNIAYFQHFSSPNYGEAKTFEEISGEVGNINYQINNLASATPGTDWTQPQRPISVGYTSVFMDASLQPYYYPILQFYTKAAWLGIVIPVTEPQMLTLNIPVNFDAGSLAQITANVKNNGETGSIDVLLTCNQNAQVISSNPFRISSLAKGSTATAYFQVRGATTTKDTKITCNVKASDVTDPRIVSNILTGTMDEIAPPQPVCGNGKCEPPTESNPTCPADCPSGITYCADGTASGKCSTSKPFYCNGGTLIQQASACGCPTGMTPQADGSCGSGDGGNKTDWNTILLIVGAIAALVVIMTLVKKKKR